MCSYIFGGIAVYLVIGLWYTHWMNSSADEDKEINQMRKDCLEALTGSSFLLDLILCLSWLPLILISLFTKH